MTDDLVTRLRGHADCYLCRDAKHDLADAADEIERLRAENRQQGKAIQIMGERWTLCGQCQEINRRGWA